MFAAQSALLSLTAPRDAVSSRFSASPSSIANEETARAAVVQRVEGRRGGGSTPRMTRGTNLTPEIRVAGVRDAHVYRPVRIARRAQRRRDRRLVGDVDAAERECAEVAPARACAHGLGRSLDVGRRREIDERHGGRAALGERAPERGADSTRATRDKRDRASNCSHCQVAKGRFHDPRPGKLKLQTKLAWVHQTANLPEQNLGDQRASLRTNRRTR